MCTLYSQVKAQAEIRAPIDAIHDTAGNLGPQPALFTDTLAGCAQIAVIADRIENWFITIRAMNFPNLTGVET